MGWLIDSEGNDIGVKENPLRVTVGGLVGLATGGSATTIVDSTKHFTVNMLQNKIVRVLIGGIEYFRVIASNTANVITIPAIVAGVKATGTLTISGVVLDGQTVTIGDEVYEFAADTAQTVGDGNHPVDITSYANKAQGTLTVDTQPTAGDTMTIGSTVYTFVANDKATPVAGDIKVGTDLAIAQANIVAAINGVDAWNDAHPSVSAGNFAANASVVTALIGGVAGNSIATTETFTAGTNVFDATTLGTTTAGTNCSAANAVTALVGSIEANSYLVNAVDGDGDTVALTAAEYGADGNSITTTETMTNGSFGHAHLEGGVTEIACTADCPYEVIL